MGNVDHLINGFRRFQQQLYRDNERLAAKLKKGQSPKVLIISCSDSRVDPALLTDCAPGDLFTLRNVANLVPPYEPDCAYHGVSAALEYAVCTLKVTDIVVLGHSSCGGIEGLLSAEQGEVAGEFIGRWVDIAREARDRARAKVTETGDESQLSCLCEQESILISMANLLTFPWLKQSVTEEKLQLHGWYFQIDSGKLYGYQQAQERFEVLVEGYESLCPLD